MSLRTAEVAARASVNVETVRYYERTGMLAAPPQPRFWMHQLRGVSEDNYLDPDVFAAQTNEALKTK